MKNKLFIVVMLLSIQASAIDFGYILLHQFGSCLVGSLLVNNIKISPQDGNRDAIAIGCSLGLGIDGYMNRETFSKDRLNLPDDPTLKEFEKIQKSIERNQKIAPQPVKK